MVPDVVIAMVRQSLEEAKVKRDRNTVELERLDRERAQYARANELLDSQIANTELWLKGVTQNVLLQGIAPLEIRSR